jgi:glycosyltransferase involved in cell wall biosynthesis
MRKRILYVQYTNPAAYPPLEHSSRILAGASWKVRFLGVSVAAVDSLQMEPHPAIEISTLPSRQGSRWQKLQYIVFLKWAFLHVLLWRPRWVYVSDVLAAPLAWAASLIPGVRVIYHEHDSPSSDGGTVFMRVCRAFRRRLGRRVELAILPNEERAARFREETGEGGEVRVVWNCPELHEVREPRPPLSGAVRLLYHGSIVRARLPPVVLEAMAAFPDGFELVVAGYDPDDDDRYLRELAETAERLGIGHRLTLVGPVPRRGSLLDLCATCDVGLAFVPRASDDFNLGTLVGASNKPFDYLACGVAVLVSDLDEWKALIVEPGYGLACDPEDVESVRGILKRIAERPEAMRAMGEEGRRRVAREWNYEAQFAPVLARLTQT